MSNSMEANLEAAGWRSEKATKRSEYLYVGQNKQEEDTQVKDALDRRMLCDLYLSALVTFLVGVTNFCAGEGIDELSMTEWIEQWLKVVL